MNQERTNNLSLLTISIESDKAELIDYNDDDDD